MTDHLPTNIILIDDVITSGSTVKEAAKILKKAGAKNVYVLALAKGWYNILIMLQKIEISSKTIIFTIGFILFLGVIWLIKDLIFSLFIAFIIAGALRQPVDFL